MATKEDWEKVKEQAESAIKAFEMQIELARSNLELASKKLADENAQN